MTVGTALRTHLVNDSNVGVNARVWARKLPQKPTLPAITYRLVSVDHVENILGSSGYARARYQINSWAETPDVATALASKVRVSLQGFSGTLGGVGGVTVGEISAAGEHDIEEPDIERYGVAADFFIGHNEATY